MSRLALRLQRATQKNTPKLYLTPPSGSYAVGSTVTVAIRENSYTANVNGVQANLSYPSNLLQFESISTSGSPFTTTIQNTGGNGSIALAVGLLGSSLSGDRLVGTATFTVLATGTANIAFTSGSAITESSGGTNICRLQQGSSYTLNSVNSAPSMSLSPTTGSYTVGSTVSVAIYENSYSTAINAAQANLTYPSSLLQFQSISTTGSPFTTTVQSTGGNGTVSLGVGLLGNSVSGNQLVGTVTFTVLAAGSASIGVATSSAVTDAATSANILQIRNGSTYNLSGSSSGQSPSLSLSPATGSYTVGNTISVAIYENSYSTSVNGVQADLTYPSGLLQFQSISTAGGAFTTTIQSNGGSGTVNLAVGLLNNSVSGNQLVGTATFTVLAAGSASIGVATSSAITDTATSSNILQTRTGSNYTLTGSSSSSPSMTLTPSTGSYTVGSTISVAIYENSYTTAVNAAQANLTYPTNLLQFQSVNNTGSAFTTAVQNTGGNGTVNLGVGLLGSSVSGNQLVGTATFTVLATGTATIGVATSSAVTDASSSNNILQVRTGSTYTLSSAAVPTIYLNPASGSYASGSTISVALRENSLTTAVNAVEINLTYQRLDCSFSQSVMQTAPLRPSLAVTAAMAR